MSKTMIFSYLTMAVGILGMLGVEVPVNFVEDIMLLLSDEALAAFMVVFGTVTAILRHLTKLPLIQGISGWLGVKDDDQLPDRNNYDNEV